jgi:hypothetical protein
MKVPTSTPLTPHEIMVLELEIASINRRLAKLRLGNEELPISMKTLKENRRQLRQKINDAKKGVVRIEVPYGLQKRINKGNFRC